MTDARDIVERLRNFAINTLAIIPEKIERHPKTDPELIVAGFSRQCDMATEAADEIASLRKQLEDARSEALEEAAKLVDSQPDNGISFQALWRISGQIRRLKGQQHG